MNRSTSRGRFDEVECEMRPGFRVVATIDAADATKSILVHAVPIHHAA
jgi:hypothetical protein